MLERFGLFEIPAGDGGAEEAAQFYAETSRALETLSSELKKISQLPEESGVEINYERFIAQFNAILGTPIERTPGDRTCRVTVADVSMARNASFPIVFIPGMSEGEFPRPVLQNAFLDDAERNRLKTGGGPALQESSEELKKEMPIFYNAVTRAREKLVLTYPALDATGQEVGCSWYPDEIKKRFDDVKVVVETIGSVALSLDAAATRREAAVAAVSEAMRPDEARGEAALPPFIDAPSLAGKIALAEERDATRNFGRYDGVLDDPRALELLRAELEKMVFSAGRIGDYLKCPFNYFCKRVLKLEELPEPTTETTPLERGTHCHVILRRFYSSRSKRKNEPAAVTPENLVAAQKELSETCEEYFDSLEKKGLVRHRDIFSVERIQIRKKLLNFLEKEARLNKEDPREPSYFELAFGFEKFLADWDAASVHETLDIPCGDFTARMRGVIDRIDVDDAGSFAVIDYKSGRSAPAAGDVKDGRDVQLQTYAMAAERLLFKNVRKAREAFFFTIAGAARASALKRAEGSDSLSPAVEAAMESIAESLKGIAAGKFQPDPPKECYAYCPCKTACKYEVRRNKKKRERDS
jgi:ATP-dependent helicase/DNAse subunit B